MDNFLALDDTYLYTERMCTCRVPRPASLDASASGHAGYVAKATVWPPRVSVENPEVRTAGLRTQTPPPIEKTRHSFL